MSKSIYEFQPDDAKRFAREQGIPTKEHGDELQFKRCPYCRNTTDDKNTFAINLKTGQFQCFRASCGAKGNMLTLARDFNFSLGTYVDNYYNPTKIWRRFGKKKPKPKPKAVEYMLSRSISEEITEKYNITSRKDHENVLVFPFYDENDELVFVKYRNTNPKEGQSKEFSERNGKPILFGMNHCDPEKNDTLVLTEGQIDSLSCAEAGIENAVSVPTGAKGFTWVPYCWDFMGKFKTLIVFGDHERDQITLLDEMRIRFHGTVKHVRPEDYLDCKDANDILQKYGKEAVKHAVENAVPIENPRIIDVASVKRKSWKDVPHFDSGIQTLDKMTGGLFMGQLIVLTGERGQGKSTLASQIGISAIDNNYPVMFYSGELNDWQFQGWFERQIAGRQNINKRTEKNGSAVYSVDVNCEHDIVDWYAGRAKLYDNAIVQSGNTENETLLETLECAIKQYGCRVLFVDNLMTAMDDDAKSDIYRQQSNFVKALSQMAKRFEVLIVLIAHPRKSDVTTFGNDDVAGSSNITNLADVVLRYGRSPDKTADPSTRCLQVLKNRMYGWCHGDKEGITLYFDEASKRISEKQGYFDWHLGWERPTKNGFSVEKIDTKEEGIEQNDLDIPFD